MMKYCLPRYEVCPVCGKKFIPAAYHVYRVNKRLVCTWGCQRKAEKEAEAKEKKRRDKNG